jgi:hypothetical protein
MVGRTATGARFENLNTCVLIMDPYRSWLTMSGLTIPSPSPSPSVGLPEAPRFPPALGPPILGRNPTGDRCVSRLSACARILADMTDRHLIASLLQ